MDVCKRENSVILLEDDYTTKYQGFDPSDPESFIFMQLMQNSHLEQSLSFAQLVSEALDAGPLSANRGIWQDPFLVLWKTAMPSVLVECGFISNSSDLTVLKSETDREKIASCLFSAFKKYKDSYDMSVALDVDVEPAAKPADKPVEKPAVQQQSDKPKAETPEADAATGVRYGVQIFAGSKKLDSRDKAFLGYKPLAVESGKVFKYIVAVSDDIKETKAELPSIRKKYPDAFLVKIEGEKVSLYK